MSPPGKKSGVTTYESVVKAMPSAARHGQHRLVVERARARGCGSAGSISLSISCGGEPAAAAVAEQHRARVSTGGHRDTRRSAGLVRGHRLLPARRGSGPRAGAAAAVWVSWMRWMRPARHHEAVVAERRACAPPSRPEKPTVSRPSSRARRSARFTLAEAPEVEMPSDHVLAAGPAARAGRRRRARSRCRCRPR